MRTIPKASVAIASALAAAAVLSVASVAGAQTDAPAPAAPAPPPPAPGPAAAPENLAAPSPQVNDAPGSSTQQKVDEASAQTTVADAKESKLPFRNSVFIFDQSVTTQTAHLEPTPQQSYVPLYEWWLSFRPRYYFTDKIYVSGRFDYFKEFTNANQTAKYREDVFGDIWTDLVYATPVPAISKGTKVSVGARLKFPTSKESQDQGIYVQAGATGSVKQSIPLRGESASYLNDMHIGLSAWYNHPFSQATTAVNPSLDYTRQDTGGRSFLSDQLTGTTLTAHSVVGVIDTGLQITPKLSWTVDLIFINNWHYTPKDTTVTTLGGGTAAVPRSPNDTNYTVSTWFLTNVDYELFDELSVGVGYYNLANELAPDGQRRGLVGKDNIWWSPDARVFFDITANLDKIYELASGQKTTTPKPPPKGWQAAGLKTPQPL